MNPDLIALGARVLQRALEKSGHVPPHVYDPGEAPPADDGLIDGLANQLVGFVGKLDAVFAAQLAAPSAELLERERARNRRLARALGACECWGESLACATCGGRGRPGSRMPDRPEFEQFIAPALRRVSAYQVTRNGRSHSLQP